MSTLKDSTHGYYGFLRMTSTASQLSNLQSVSFSILYPPTYQHDETFQLHNRLSSSPALRRQCPSRPLPGPLQVPTESGTLHGFIDSTTPGVRQFLGVPFAIPPIGTRRWLPPMILTNSTSSMNATSFGLSCPQIPLSAQVTPDVFSPKGGNRTEFFPLEKFSEDCLTLNVWAPARPQGLTLPVLVWFFGGGFVQGGTNSLVNFRSNIFGFPNAAGLADQNLGLLDQRVALEWVRTNIGGFGGDAQRIVAWGESAGAIAADFLNFAFPADPIVYGSIMESGTALFPASVSLSTDTAQVNFATVAAQLGCAPGAAQIECMRAIPAIPDERIVFADYTARYAAGAFARVPALIGTNQHELNALGSQVPGMPLNQTALDIIGNQTFLCTAAATSKLRQAHGLTTFRYQYDGDFANISPPEFLARTMPRSCRSFSAPLGSFTVRRRSTKIW
ncbi:Alpha/Beta hydrolase protein [Mycena leptocephala]|nr:Alpha/Beta hydrolase protein [Mycena leptocephala]